jgi:hypothetical protein
MDTNNTNLEVIPKDTPIIESSPQISNDASDDLFALMELNA